MSALHYSTVFAGNNNGRKNRTNEKTIILGNFPIFIGGRYRNGGGLRGVLHFPRFIVARRFDTKRRVGYLLVDYRDGVRVLRRAVGELDFIGKIRFPRGKKHRGSAFEKGLFDFYHNRRNWLGYYGIGDVIACADFP